MATRITQTDRVLREPEVEHRTGLSRSTRWRMERTGKFPRRKPISANAVGWLESEIDAWIAALTAESEGEKEAANADASQAESAAQADETRPVAKSNTFRRNRDEAEADNAPAA